MDAAPDRPRLRASLGLLDVLAIGINATVGSGVFALPDDMARAMGGWSPLGFLFCALLLLPVALCFSELAKRHEDQGAAFLYAHAAFGPTAGYFVGFFCWVNSFVSWAACTTLLASALGLSSLAQHGFGALAAVLLGAVNYFGVRPGALVVRAVVVGKVGAILCFLGVGLASLDPARLGGALPLGLAGVGQGIYVALFPLQGFEVAPVAAGETRKATRNVPLGTLGALLFSAALFVLVQLALVGSYAGLAAKSDQPLVDAASSLSPALGRIVAIGSVISIAGFTAGSALGSPRYAQAVAGHGLLPRALASVHARWGSPHVAIACSTGAAAVLALAFDYRTLVGMSNLTVVVQYVASCLALLALRRRDAAAAGRALGARDAVIPAVGALGSVGLLAGTARAELLYAGGALALAIVIRRAMQRAAPTPPAPG